MGRAAGLVLPRLLGRGDVGAQVVDQQGRHEGVRRGGVEHLDAEPVRSGVGRGQRLVLHDGAGSGRRCDVERDGGTRLPRRRGTPALDALGQGVVRPLLRHQRVADARIHARRVVALQQPTAAHDAGGVPGHPPDPTAAVRGRRPLHLRARHGEDVRRRGQVGERRAGPLVQEVVGEGVGGQGDPHVLRPVGVAVRPEHQAPRRGEGAQPVRERRQLPHEVGPHVAAAVGASAGDDARGQVHRARAVQGDGRDAVLHVGPGEVDRHHLGAPALEGAVGTHLGARAEHHHHLVVEPQPLRVRLHGADGVGAGRSDDAALDPLVELAREVVAPQPLAAVRQRQLRLRLAPPRDRRRAQHLLERAAPERLLEADVVEAHRGACAAQAVLGDGSRGSRVADTGLHRAGEVAQVLASPRRLVLDRPRPDRVGLAQGVGEHRPARRRRAVGPERHSLVRAHVDSLGSGELDAQASLRCN